MKPLVNLLSLIALFTLSCKSQKPDKPIAIPEGYLSGLLAIVEDSPCKYQFKSVSSDETFDLIDAESKLPSHQLKNGQQIILKIVRLRQANRCDNLLPAQVIDVSTQ
jgi:hypothetical protein